MTKIGQMIGRAYIKFVQPRLPRRTRSYNGVEVPSARLFDSILPWIDSSNKPSFEQAIIESLNKRVQPGDEVVVVGGGWGATTVTAANLVGPTGQVITYEASEEAVESVRKTLQLNEVEDRVKVRHAVISRAIKVWGEKGNPNIVPPSDLPTCDVLELDCEGAELDILDGLEIRPETIIVETHAHLGAPEEEVRKRLDALSYEVVERGIEEPENGVFVLTATRMTDAE